MDNLNGKPRFPYVMFDLGSTLIYFDGEWNKVFPLALDRVTRRLRSLGYDLDEGIFPDAYGALIQEYAQKRSDTFLEFTALSVLEEALRAHSPRPVSAEDAREALRAFYDVTQKYWKLEPDTVPMLETLRARGCRLGIISNASDDEDVQELVDQASIRGYFDFVLTSAAAGVRKPNPRIFQQALAFWGARPDQSVMIGDLVPADVAGANPLGIASVWIARRADTPENHAAAKDYPPGAVIYALSELPEVLERWK